MSDEISDCGIENSRRQGCVVMYMGSYVSLSLSLQSFMKRVDLINYLNKLCVIYCALFNWRCIVLTGSLTLKNKTFEL